MVRSKCACMWAFGHPNLGPCEVCRVVLLGGGEGGRGEGTKGKSYARATILRINDEYNVLNI